MVARDMKNFYSDIQNILHEGVQEYGSIRKLAATLSMNPSTISKWIEKGDEKPDRSPNLRDLAPIMDLLHVRAVRFGEISAPSTAELADDDQKAVVILKKRLAECEAELKEQSGMIKALEKQVARLAPAPAQAAPLHTQKSVEEEPPVDSGKKVA